MIGVKDLNYEIMYYMDDKSLGELCKTSKKLKALCENDTFWRNRIEKLYGSNLLKYKKEDQTWKNFYINSEEIKRIKLCRQLRDLPHTSKLVIDDLYNPVTGYINARSTLDESGITYVVLKITLNKMLQSSIINDEEIRKLQSLIDNLVPALQDQGRTFSLDTYKFTQVDYDTFINIINVPYLTKRHLYDNMKSEVKRSLGVLDDVITKRLPIILYIHQLFYERKLSPFITWNELCNQMY